MSLGTSLVPPGDQEVQGVLGQLSQPHGGLSPGSPWVLGDPAPSRRLPEAACEHQGRTAEARFPVIPKPDLGQPAQ